MQMKKKPVKADKKRAQKQSFRKILQVLGLTERAAAELFGIDYTRVNNILRRESPIGDKLAVQIESATGISAKSLLRGDTVPVMLNGKKLNRGSFEAWRGLEIPEESKQAQPEEIGWMSALLLEAAGAKGNHLRRRTYHLLRGLLEDLRIEAGISMAEIHEQAMKGAQFSTHQATRDQLDDAIGNSPMYQAIRSKLPAKGLIEVAQDAFQTWCDPSAFASILPEVPDSMEVTRVIYRFKIGEQWHPVIVDQFSGRGTGSPGRARKLKKSIGKSILY